MFFKTLGYPLNKVEEIIETQDHINTTFAKKDNEPLFKHLSSLKNPRKSICGSKVNKKNKWKRKRELNYPQATTINEEMSSKVETHELIKIFKESQD